MDLGSRVDTLMDGLTADLERLAAIPSVAFPGFPAEPVRQAHDLLVDLLRGAGVERVERLDLPDTAPVIVAEVPPPTPDAPRFEPATGGPAYRAALTALREGWGAEPALVAGGGSIPLVNGLAKAVPGAEILLLGAQDSMCNLHAPNERVLFCELRSAVIAEAAFLREYAATHRGGSTA